MGILLVTTEPVPLPGLTATGAGLRAWALAEGLRSRGFEVEIAMAADAIEASNAEALREAKPFLFERERLTEHVRERRPDALVMQHWGLMDRLGEIDCPLAIDLAGPHLLERRFWGTPSPERDLEHKLSALARADFLTCSGERQRDYFLGFALQAGFDPTAGSEQTRCALSSPHSSPECFSDLCQDPTAGGILPVIPFSVSPEIPEEKDYDPESFIYTGFLLPWQDPSVGVEALLDTLESRGRGRFDFIGGAHPAGDVSQGRFDGILKRIEASLRASLKPPRAFDALTNDMGTYGVAFDLMARNLERELAFPSRTVVYLTHGLPVITNDYSELSHLVKRYDAGWLLNPLDAEGIANLIGDLLDHPHEIARRRDNARRLVRECLTWDKTIAPLADWCANPTVRPGKEKTPDPWKENERLRLQLEKSNESLREMSGRRLVKFSNYLRKIGLRKRL